MPLIFYVTHDNNMYEADVAVGQTIMQGAVHNMIDGILAECGGMMNCATCHCYIDEKWLEQVGEASAAERAMLNACTEPKHTSRLSCQVTVTDKMDGLIVHLPESQY